MLNNFAGGILEKELTRRDFLLITALSSAGLLAGCAINPVTGMPQLMLVSERQEIDIDKKHSPHQFSADYGALQDNTLNNYIDKTGKSLASLSHRPGMPYSFRGVNATYVNAYAFPGGSIACTRGILLALDNEAELAALLGHELGHVNARHTAEQMSKGILTSVALSGLAAYVGSDNQALGELAANLGNLGAGVLLAKYSRDNEREADALGMEYMFHGQYNPNGMVGLMDMLRSMSKHNPSVIELMFATHPMSDERYSTVLESTSTQYKSAEDFPLHRDRYMDHTAKLRLMKKAVAELQDGEKEMAKKNFRTAEEHFQRALSEAPEDYTGFVMMAKCQLAQKKYGEAHRYAQLAKQVNPQEAQAYYVGGISKIEDKDYGAAHEEFSKYENLLPGNPTIIFLKGYSLEGMSHIKDAANEYQRYLEIVNQGEQAQHAYRRLVEWGYISSPRK